MNTMNTMNKTRNIWENRYKTNGNSGIGSYGVLCDYKASFINKFIIDNNCKNIVEFGSGDGNQMYFINIEKYTGVDISEYIINVCKQKYKHLTNKKFINYDEYYKTTSSDFDLSLSLDVIYHLVEDDIYEMYMNDLFNSTSKYVIIYSTNWNADYNGSHVRHRKFTEYVDKNILNAKLIHHETNKYPELSTAEMYIYSKI
jgi:hypothetical protein